jgi:hypothetical protein
MHMTPRQCRMARAGLGWNLDVLARTAGVSVNTLRRLEDEGGVTMRTLAKVQATLQQAGVLFHAGDTVSLPEARELSVSIG